MSNLLRRKLERMTPTNDFSLVKWDSLDIPVEKANLVVGKNCSLRYGIATESDQGLDTTSFVLVPTLVDIGAPEKLAKVYSHNVTMIGRHVLYDTGAPVSADAALKSSDYAAFAAREAETRDDPAADSIKLSEKVELRTTDAAPDEMLGELTCIAAYMNYKQFEVDYPTVPSGVQILGSHVIAMAYRNGLLESRAGREFVFAQVARNNDGSWRVVTIDPAYDKRVNPYWKRDAVIDRSVLRLSSQFTELGLGVCIGAGATHYIMNHTTGGRSLNGQNARALALNGLYKAKPGPGERTEVEQTTFYYNALHPINKRAIAALIINGSHVNSWYKNYSLPCPAIMYSDTFMSYRQKLIPAGSHKTFVAMLALKNICEAALYPFLPNQELADRVISTYQDTYVAGARAHVGSLYYTDQPMSVTQTEIDDFLPTAAYYVTKRAASSTLAASPHLDVAIADSAPDRWKQIVDMTVRSAAIAATPEAIAKYLGEQGALGYKIDLTTPEGIEEATRINREIKIRLDAVLNS